MAEVADAFEQWMRDYVTDGVPASGINPPSKAEGRAIGALIEAYIADQISAASITTPITPPGPYVMPVFVDEGTPNSGYTATPGWFTGVAADDIAILSVATWEFGGYISPPPPTPADPVRPSGWTQIGTTVTQGGLKQAVYWKRCDGTESGTVAVGKAAGGVDTRVSAVISGWRGCVANGDPYEAVDTDHGAGSPGASRSVTTLGPERKAVIIWAFYNGGGSPAGPDTGYTEVYQVNYAGDNINFVGDVQAMTVAGTAAAASRTSGGSTFAWSSFAFALLPST